MKAGRKGAKSETDGPAGGDGEKLIHADELETLTGLSDRRHRQLAKDGWFPAPSKSQYVMVPTLQGIFRYYREQGMKDTPKAKLTTAQEEGHRLRNRLRELEVEREAGTLRPVDDLREAYRVSMEPLKQSLDGMPDGLATRCNPTDPDLAREALRQWVQRTRDQIALACSAA